MSMSNQIKKLLSEGDVVYSARTGKPMRVTKVSKFGFYTEKKYFSFDDVRKKYYLTQKGYEDSLKEKLEKERRLEFVFRH